MATTNARAEKSLKQLYRIVEAGERGFATASNNAHDRAMKVLFKSYAQQRADFKQELLDEMERLGSSGSPSGSIPAAIHRGRVAIFAAMTIEDKNREKVILKEAAIGERVAANTYQKTLESELPTETKAIVQRQYEAVQSVRAHINRLLGSDSQRLVMHLFNTETEADTAIRRLDEAGFALTGIQKSELSDSVERYHGKGATMLETALSGAFGGAFWGIIIGILAALGAVQTSLPGWLGVSSVLGAWALIALAIMLTGAVVGAILGFIIGMGISEDDTHLYRRSLQDGQIILQMEVDQARAVEAINIMDQITRQSNQAARTATA